MKPGLTIQKNKITLQQDRSIPVKDVIDHPFYPDDAILSLFANVVYKSQELKIDLDAALQVLKEGKPKKKKEIDANARNLIEEIQRGKNWTVYAWAENEEDHYFGAAFWNAKYSQLVISHRGTVPKWDKRKTALTDLEGVVQQKYTNQIFSACTFTNSVLKDLNRRKIHISITGHSLGGWLGQIATFAAEYLTTKNGVFTRKLSRDPESIIHCVVLDSPGCSEMLCQIAGQYFDKYDNEAYILISALDITIYFNEPNLVNCCNSHRGISRLLQIYDPSNRQKNINDLKKESWYHIIISHETTNFLQMLKTHSGKNFLSLLTTSKEVEIKKVLNWPSFHLPEAINKKSSIENLTVSKTLIKMSWLIKPAMKTLLSSENELLNYYKKILESDENKNYSIEEHFGGIDHQYNVENFVKSNRNVAIFTENEKQFLKYWKQVYVRKIAFKKLKNIQKLLEKNRLASFENFLPLFEIQFDNNKNEIISCCPGKDSEDLEKVIRRVKQLHALHPEAFDSMKKDIYDYYVPVYKSLSNRYQRKLPTWDVDFEDTINLENFLDSNENLLCLRTERDTKDEVFRVRYLLQELKSDEMSQCYLGLAEFRELRNQVDVQKIYEDVSCSVDNILVIDCKAKKIDSNDDGFEDFIKMVKSRESAKKVILVVDCGNKWVEKMLQKNLIEVQNVEYLFSDFTEDTQRNFLMKEVATLWGKDEKIAQFCNSSDLQQLSQNEIEFLSLPNVLNFLLTDEPDLCELSSSYVIANDNMKVLTADIQKTVELKWLFEFLEKGGSELNEIFEKPVMFMISGISKNYLQEMNENVILECAEFLEDDLENFERLCCNNKDKRIYWVDFSQDNPEEVKLKKIFDSDFYLERILYRHDEINKTKLSQILNKQMDSDPCTFIFSNINREQLSRVLNIEKPQNINWINAGNSFEEGHFTQMKSSIKCFLGISVAVVAQKDEASLFNEIAEKSGNPVHLIRAAGDSEKFFWVRSKGSLQTIRGIVDTDRSTIFCELRDKTVLMIGESGSGKSTLLLKMANQLDSSWVLWVNLVNLRNKIEDFDEQLNLDGTVNFLLKWNYNAENLIVRDLLKFNLTYQTKIPVFVFFDGFDEIMEDVQKKILDVIKFLQYETNATVYVTTKNWAANLLENELSVFSTKIQEISQDQKKKYIRNFWLAGFNVNDNRYNYKELLLYKADELFEEYQTINFRKALPPSNCTDLEDLWDRRISPVTTIGAEYVDPLLNINVLDTIIIHLPVFYNSDKNCQGDSMEDKIIKFHSSIVTDDKNFALSKLGGQLFLQYLLFACRLSKTENIYSQKYLTKTYVDFKQQGTFEKEFAEKWVQLLSILNEYFIVDTSQHGSDILAIPLQLRMTGEILQQENDFTTAKQTNWDLLNNIYELYNKFIMMKFKIYFKEKLHESYDDEIIKDLLLEKHKSLAFQIFFANDSEEILGEKEIFDLNNQFWKNVTVKVNQMGIATILNSGEFKFNHISFAEYFSATKIHELLSRKNWYNQCLEDLILGNVLMKEETKMIRQFLNGQLKSNQWRTKQNEILNFFIGPEKSLIKSDAAKFSADACLSFSELIFEERLSRFNKKIANEKGETALHICAFENLKYLAESFLANFDDHYLQSYIDVVNINSETAFYYTALNMNYDFATMLFHKGMKENILQFHVHEVEGINYNQLAPDAIIVISISRKDMKIFVIEDGEVTEIIDNGKSTNILEVMKLDENIDKFSCMSNLGLFTLLNLVIECDCSEYFSFLINRLPDCYLKFPELLHSATKKGNRDVVIELLARGSDINAKDSNGETPIIIAADNGQWDIVSDLIQNGANVNISARENEVSPIHFPAAAGRADIVLELIKAGADINAAEKHKNATPIYLAAAYGHWDVVLELINHKANVNIPTENGMTLLHVAASEGKRDIVTKLLEAEADINAMDLTFNEPPVFHAALSGHWDIVLELIKRGSNVNIPSLGSNQTVLYFAAFTGAKEVVSAALDAGADINVKETSDNWTPVLGAAIKDNWDIVLELIHRGADVKIPSKQFNLTVLYSAALNGVKDVVLASLDAGADIDAAENFDNFTPVLAAASQAHWDIALELIHRGANVKMSTLKANWTVLYLAAAHGAKEVVLASLDAGADIDAVEINNMTAVNIAASEGHWDIALELINRGADVTIVSSGGNMSALTFATGTMTNILKSMDENAEISHREQLIESICATSNDLQGSKVRELANQEMSMIASLLPLTDRYADAALEREHKSMLLLFATFLGDKKIAVRYLDAGADVNSMDKVTNLTAINSAACLGHWDIVSELIDRGANVNIPTLKHNQTVLYFAALKGAKEVILKLLEVKADVNIIEKSDNMTSVNAAASHGHWDIVLELIKRGANVKIPSLKYNATVLYFAAVKNEKEVILKSLEAGADIDAVQTFDNLTPVNAAASQNNWESVLELIQQGANVKIPSLERNRTVLYFAASAGVLEVVLKSLDAGADIDAVERSDNLTPVNAAAQQGHWDVVLELMNRGANVKIPSLKNNRTVLYFAAKEGAKEVVLKALDAGADIDAVETSANLTPVNVAASQGHWDIVLELINRGANIEVPTLTYKQTVLHFAAWKGAKEVVLKLLDAGADIDAVETFANATPVNMAACMGHWDIVHELLIKGANPDIPEKKFHNTVMHFAALNGKLDIVKELLNRNANMDPINIDNETPLQFSALENHWDIVFELINQGADIYLPNGDLEILELAEVAGQLEALMKVLEEKN